MKPAPTEAKKKCSQPILFSEYITEDQFNALDGQGKVNTLVTYTTSNVFGALGECNTRHSALRKYAEEVQQ